MSNEQEERWYVQLDSQEVRLMTLDELDGAFQEGLVHEETYVIPVGGSNWQTLGEMLGSGEDEEEEVGAPAPAPAPVTAPVAAPVAARLVPPQLPATAQGFAAPQPARAAGQVADSAWPPVALAPSAANNSRYSNPQSVMPVVQDVALSSNDPDLASFKPKKTKMFLALAAAAAALGGVGVAVARLDTPPTHAVEAPKAAAALPAPAKTYSQPSTPTPAPEPTPAPAAAATPSASDSKDKDVTSTGRLSEDMKKALLAKDEERASKKKGRAKASATRRASAGSKGGSGPFKGGGNAHDPLNSKL